MKKRSTKIALSASTLAALAMIFIGASISNPANEASASSADKEALGLNQVQQEAANQARQEAEQATNQAAEDSRTKRGRW